MELSKDIAYALGTNGWKTITLLPLLALGDTLPFILREFIMQQSRMTRSFL